MEQFRRHVDQWCVPCTFVCPTSRTLCGMNIDAMVRCCFDTLDTLILGLWYRFHPRKVNELKAWKHPFLSSRAAALSRKFCCSSIHTCTQGGSTSAIKASLEAEGACVCRGWLRPLRSERAGSGQALFASGRGVACTPQDTVPLQWLMFMSLWQTFDPRFGSYFGEQ